MIYLCEDNLILLNERLIQRYSPTEPVSVVDTAALNMVVNLPKLEAFGQELYPTVFSKGMILFVQLVKKHCFANANKRTATYALIKFLRLNGYHLSAEVSDLVEFSVEVAVEPLTDENLRKWTDWIECNSERIN